MLVKNVKKTTEVCIDKINAPKSASINYNTYLMLTPQFKALVISSLSSGKYHLKIKDYQMGFYFIYSEVGMGIKVPLNAIFNTNDKLRGILGIKWASALECPSRRRGLCQLDDTNNCYAVKGEKQGSKKSYNFLKGMGSYYNSLISIYYFNLFNKSAEVRGYFKKYIEYYNIDTLRFNLSGDFKNTADLKNLEYIAEMGVNLTGYTARDDLMAEIMGVLNNHDNIIINGSNMMYTNIFNAVDSIEAYFNAQHQCIGGCLKNGCLNCYRLKGAEITVLIHGSDAGVTLNTAGNRAFICSLLNSVNIDITPAELKRFKDLYRALNTLFERGNYFKLVPAPLITTNKSGKLKFNSHHAVINYLRALYLKGGF